jgi:hypothetical protein
MKEGIICSFSNAPVEKSHCDILDITSELCMKSFDMFERHSPSQDLLEGSRYS